MRLLRPGLWLLFGALLAPAVALTLLRFLELPHSRAVQIQAFADLALPLYAGAALVGALILATTWHPLLRVGGGVGALVALCGLVPHLLWVAPYVLGEVPRGEPGAAPITVMSANLLAGRADPGAVVAAVGAHDVDVLVLVEVADASLVELSEAGIDDLLPYGVRSGDVDPGGGHSGTAVLARSPVEAIAQIDTAAPSLVVDAGDLRLMAVHPLPPLDAERWRADHGVLLDAADAFAPDVVAGDFNATFAHRTMRRYRDRGYRDAVEIVNGGFRPTWPTRTVPGLPSPPVFLGPLVAIDHVLVDEHWTALDVATGDLPGSDHRYVAADVVRRR